MVTSLVVADLRARRPSEVPSPLCIDEEGSTRGARTPDLQPQGLRFLVKEFHGKRNFDGASVGIQRHPTTASICPEARNAKGQ